MNASPVARLRPNRAPAPRNAPGARAAALLLAALVFVVAAPARAAPPAVNPLVWNGTPNDQANVAEDFTLRLVYGVSNATDVAIAIDAPGDVYIRSIGVASGATGPTLSTTYTREPSSTPWNTSALLTYTGPASNFSGTLEIVFTARNGGFLRGQQVDFGATIDASNPDGAAAQSLASYTLRLLSSPALAFSGLSEQSIHGVYGGQVGTFRRFTFSALRENANGRVEPGLTTAFAIPAPGVFVSATPANTAQTWTVTATPAPGTSGTVTAQYGYTRGRAPQLTATGALPPLSTLYTDTAALTYTYFVPCNALAPDATYTAPLTGTGTHLGVDPSWDQTATAGAASTLTATSCNLGTTGKGINTEDLTAIPGQVINYHVSALAPTPASGFPTDIVVVDRLPTQAVTFSAASFAPGTSTSFALHLCAAPNLPGTFTYADFAALSLASTADAHCRPSATFTTPALATHVVAYAAQWRDLVAAPDTWGILPLGLRIDAIVNADATAGSFVNRECLDGPPNGAPTPWVGSPAPFAASYDSCIIGALGGPPETPAGCGQACFTLTNATDPAIWLAVNNPANPFSPNVYNRGDTAEFFVTIARTDDAYLLIDPLLPSNRVRVTIPAGFDVVSAQQISACLPDVVVGGPETSAAIGPQTLAGTQVVFTPLQLLSVERCGVITLPYTTWGFKITTTVSDTYPFISQQFYPAVASFNVSNSSETPSMARNVSVFAPSELALELGTSSCEREDFGVTATFVNQGGETLPVVVLELAVPPDSTYADHDPPTFLDTATQQSVAIASTVAWVVAGVPLTAPPSDLSTVEAIRLTVPSLPPYVQGSLDVFFATALTSTTFTLAADITDDAGHATSDTEAVDTTGCPCTVNITKTLSADGVSTPMPGAAFLLEGPSGYAATHTTDAAGALSVQSLPPGTYTLTELAPLTAGGAAVSGPFPGGAWSTTFTLIDFETQTFVLDNACTCPDAPCVDEGACGWDAGTATASCSSTPVVCGEGLCGEVCDPSLDACVPAEPTPCEAPGGRLIWGSVVQADGTEKLFKCVVMTAGGTPTCEIDPVTGYLELYDVVGGECAP